MAVTAGWYGEALKGQWSATAARRQDWVTGDTLKCGLTTSSYTINAAGGGNTFYSDITNELTTTGGYTVGGVTLGSRAFSIVGSQLRLDAADAQWTSSSFTARRSFVYFDTAGASTTDPLFTWVDFGADQTVSSGTFTIQWDSTGIATVSYT